MAIRLNNLASLLRATNRLQEAEPWSRQQVRIFLKITRRTGHEHPHLQVAVANYEGILKALGRSDAAIQAEFDQLMEMEP